MTRVTQVVGAALCVAAGAGITWCARPSPGPAGPPKVITEIRYMEHERVPLNPSLGAKLTTVAATPTQTRVADAPSPQGRKSVSDYCSPRIVLQDRGKLPIESAQIEKTPQNDSVPTPTARLPDFQGHKVGPQITLLSTLNDGRRWRADYRVRGRISWQSSGDSVLVRGDRMWVRVLRGAPKCGAAAALNGGFGALVDHDRPARGLLLGSLSTIAGCLLM